MSSKGEPRRRWVSLADVQPAAGVDGDEFLAEQIERGRAMLAQSSAGERAMREIGRGGEVGGGHVHDR